MKKMFKISILVLAIITMITMLNLNNKVFADGDENYVVELNGVQYESFDQALIDLKACTETDNTLKLLADVDDTGNTGSYQFKAFQNVTIDLNGHNLSTGRSYIIFRSGITLKGNGIVNFSQQLPIEILGSNSTSVVSDETHLEVGENVTLNSTYDEDWAYMITMPFSSYKAYVNGITVDFNGKITAAEGVKLTGFYVNGNLTETQAVFNLSNTAVVDAQEGIYAAGDATWNVSGKINAVTDGIEIRAGRLNIADATISATYIPTTVEANGNGGTTLGAAIAIAQHTTKMPINVNISGGTFTGFTALNQSNPQENSEEDVDKVELSITGGTFINLQSSDPEPTNSVYSENKTKFITGGTYDIEPHYTYIADGYIAYNKGEKYVVAPDSSYTYNKNTVVRVGETIDLNVVAAEEKAQDFIMINDISEDNSIIKVESQKITGLKPGVGMITISLGRKGEAVEIYVYDIESADTESEADNTAGDLLGSAISNGFEEETLGLTEEEIDKIGEAIIDGKVLTTEIVFDELSEENIEEEADLIKVVAEDGSTIVGYFNISINLNVDGEKIAELRELGESIEVELKLPEKMTNVEEGYTRTYSVIRVHNGVAEVVATGLTTVDGVLKFESSEFSTYAVAYTDTKTATDEKDETEETKEESSTETEEKAEEATSEAKEIDTKTEGKAQELTNPKTGDKILVTFVILAAACAGLFMIKNKKRYTRKH